MSKQRKSKLDGFAEKLDEWFSPKEQGGHGLTLAQAALKLAEFGCPVSPQRLSQWWERRQQEKLQKNILEQITSGSKQCQEVEEAFKKNPAPAVETLIKLHRVLILNLTSQGTVNPALLELANEMTKTVLNFVSGQTKAGFEARRLFIKEGEFCELLLDRAVRARAEEISGLNISQAEKIAAMRQAAFAQVDALEASGEVKIPRRPGR